MKVNGCKVRKAKNGKINKVLDFSGNESKLFKEILNIPVLSMNEALEVYKGIYGEKLRDKVKFQIIGEQGAKNLDNIEESTFRLDNLLVAQEMEKADKTPLEIRLSTGWEINLADKKWRYEILDGDVKPIKLNAVVTLPTFENKLTEIKLSDLYVNKELYNAYPKLKESRVYVYESDIPLYDSNKMFAFKNDIYINKKTYETRDNTLYYSESEGHPLQHEIQHLLQNIEGFARGTSPIWSREKTDESIKSLRSNFDANKRRSGIEGELDEYTLRLLQKNLPKNFVDSILKGDDTFLEGVSVLLGRELYKNFAGEVESRNVESRVGMSAEERLNTLLSETQSIPFEDQFVLQMKSSTQSSAKTAPQITEELIDKLKQNGLANDVFQLSSQEIDDKLKEIGVGDDVRKQVIPNGSGFYKQILEKGFTTDGAPYYNYKGVKIKLNFYSEYRNFKGEYGIYELYSDDVEETNTFVLDSIESTNRNSGEASEALKIIKDASDSNNIKIQLIISSFGKDGLNNKGLEDWYTKNGFKNIGEKIFQYTPIVKPQFQKQLSKLGIVLTVNGFTYKNDVYLNKDTATDETLLHEYQHLFLNWAKTERPEIYNKGLNLIEQELEKENSEIQDIIDFVKQNQPNLKGETFKEEVLTEFVSRYSQQMMDDQKSKSPLMQWLSDFWTEIKNILSILDATPEQVANMSLKEFAESSVSSLLSGENINEIKLTYNEQGQHLAPNGKPSNLTVSQAIQVRTQKFMDWFGDWQNDLENASKVVDENSEPLVVYHGTNANFNEFKKGNELVVDSAIGSHFAKDIQVAKNIERKRTFEKGVVKSVFLNMRSSENFLLIDEKNGDYDGDVIRNYILKQVFIKNSELFDIFKKEAKGLDDVDSIDNALEYYDYFDSSQNNNFRKLLKDIVIFYNKMTKDIDGIVYKNTDPYELEGSNDSTSYIAFNPNQIKSATENTGEFSNNSNDIRYQIIGEKGIKNTQDAINRLGNLKVAQEMEQADKTPKEIRLATGWEKGADGLFRYEISDGKLNEVKLNYDTKNKMFENPTANIKLSELYTNKELFEAYPNIENTEVIFYDTTNKIYDENLLFVSEQKIYINKKDYDKWKSGEIPKGLQDRRTTLEQGIAHELAHIVQRIEGFAQGSSKYRNEELLKVSLSFFRARNERTDTRQGVAGRYDAYVERTLRSTFPSEQVDNILNTNDIPIDFVAQKFSSAVYTNFAGEVEARNVETRFNFSSQERLNTLLSETQKILFEDQFILQNKDFTQASQKAIEPSLTIETPNGETFTNYQQALQATDIGKIKIKIDDILLAEVDSNTDIRTFQGTINHLVKHGGLSGERVLDTNGDIIYITQGETNTAKYLTSELVEKQAIKLLGVNNVKYLKTGDFVLVDNLNKTRINGEVVNNEDLDNMSFENLSDKFGEEKALEIEFQREYVKMLQPTTNKKLLEAEVEFKSDDDLVRSIKSLLNSLGIKITSIEDYIKNNTIKNNGVAPQANALMDLVNKVMAFKNGTATREDLIEETMHLIEATIDPTTTEGLRRNISKTAEWKQYSEEYFNIYSKEYTGEKLDEMVRREILGKVMANAIINNFAQSENTTLTEQSIFSKIREILENFFNTINNYFKPEYQIQIDNLNNDIYAKLMAGTLANDLNLEQNYGTKFRLYSLSNNLSNDVVRLQKEAEKALQILRRNTQQIASDDPSLSQQMKAATQMLKQSVEKGDGIEAQIELIATFSKIMNMVQKQTKYLERVAKKAVANKRPFSSEEMIVYTSLKQDFNNNILPVIEGHLKIIGNKNPAEIRLEQAYNKTIKEINGLLSDVENNGFKPEGYIIDLMVKRLSLNKEQEAFMRERIKGQQQETNWFFMNFGSLSHASNTYLNVLGAIVTKTDGDKREGFQQDTKPFLEKLNELKRLGTSFKDLIKGDFLQSSLDFNEIEKQTAIQKYESFFKMVDKQLLTETKDIVITNLNKIKATKLNSTDPLYNKTVKEFDDEQINGLEGIYYSDFKIGLEDWQKEEYRMSPMKLEFTRKRREILKGFSKETQSFERDYSATYSDIMSKAEVVDGIPLISHEMREAITNLRRLRTVEKELYNREGIFKSGLANAKEGDDGAIQIAEDKYIRLLPNASTDAILAAELNQIDYKKLEDNKNKNKDKDGSGMTKKFRDMFSKLDDDQAYDFLMLNSFVGYTEEYYNETKTPSIISKLEKAKNEENGEAIQELIEEILANTTQMSNILKANKVMNNPAEVSYDDMETDETNNIRTYSENLERYYAEARQYLSKEEAKQEDRVASETIPNKAFLKYLVDAQNQKATVELDYKNYKKLEKDDLINIDKIFDAILGHVTNSKSKNIRNYRSIPTQETISNFTVAQKRIFSLTEEQYNKMDKDERVAMMTNELLQFSYTQLLPYFRKSTPTGLDSVLLELENGTITPQAFLAEYERTDSERDERYKYLSITPNYNFQDSADNENKNVHFDNTRLNNSPFVRIFEDVATIDNIKGKSAQQLKTEGKLSKYADIEFLERYGIDLPTLFTIGVETATKDLKNFDARQTLIDLQKKSVEKNGMSGKHNIYLLPQKEASLTKKADRFIKDGKLKNIKDIVREAFNFREDDIELGENNDSTNTQLSDGNHSIPKYGFRRLKEAPVTDDLLESYMWMNYKANEHLARKINIGDVLSLEEALVDATFEGNISATTSRVYKMFKENKDFNYYGIKETWSSTFKIGNMTFDWAKIVKNFGFIIRLRNLGFALISPITSLTTGLVNFDIIERIVGDTVDKDAINKASIYFKNNANAAMREIMGFQGKSKINSLGEFWGWYDPIERFENTDYGKVVRGIPATAFAAHSMANFPVNPRVGLAILANNKFVEGELMEYMDYKLTNKDKTEKENREKWAKYTSVLEVMRVDEKDGLVSYEYDKIAKALNNNFTEAEAKEFIEAQAVLIRGRIKAGIQKVDGQISTEDKSMSSRNAFGSFLNIHRSWLMIAVQNKFKSKQFNYTTKRMEEGSYNTFFKHIIFDKIIGESRKVGVLKAIKNLREEYKDYDNYVKKNVKRTLTEMSVLTTLIALTLMGLKELDDDDEDSYAFKAGALFLFRTTNEVASGTTALPLNIYETTDNLVVGLNTIEVLTEIGDVGSSDIIERGRYAGLTERQRYFFKHAPLMKDYNNLFRDVEGTINSYNYFNFTKNKTLEMMPTYFLLDEIINDEEEQEN